MKNPSVILRKYGTAAETSLRARLAYPASLAGSFLTYGLFVFVFSRIWSTVYAQKASLAGYDREAVIWYFIVAEVSLFGLGRFFGTLSADVKRGQTVYLMARPYDFTAFNFAQAMGPALVESLLLGAEGAVIGSLVAGPPPLFSASQAAALVVSLFFAASIQFFLQFSIAMTAFWVEENDAFFWIYQKIALIGGTLLPIEFLPRTARAILSWTPFPSITWAPARILVAWNGRQGMAILVIQAAWTVAAGFLCRLVFRSARERISINGG
jgi:ABC-2 type transport system permease protein